MSCVDDTATVHLTLSPELTADVKVSADAGNELEAHADGLFITTGGATQIVRGVIDSDGSVLYGTGFTCHRSGVGVYTIHFDSAFAHSPSVVATVYSVASAPTLAIDGVPAASSFNVKILNSTGDPADSAFGFIAEAT